MRLSNRTLLGIVIALGIGVALAATNPTTSDYGKFLEAVLNRALDRMDQMQPASQRKVVQGLLMSQGRQMIESVIRSNTVRRNYGLFSIFETRVFDVRLVVLGVGMTFVPIDGQEAIEKN